MSVGPAEKGNAFVLLGIRVGAQSAMRLQIVGKVYDKNMRLGGETTKCGGPVNNG
jgi:hypothetical protein